MSLPDYYTMLGLPRFYATQQEIRSAYLKQARFFHPDLNNVSPEIAHAKMQELNAAYSTLSDIQKKRDYDETLFKYLEQKNNAGTPTTAPAAPKVAPAQKKPPKVKKRRDPISTIIGFLGIAAACLVIYALSDLQSPAESPASSPIPTTTVTATITPKPTLTPVSVQNGQILRHPPTSANCPLTVETSGTNNYYVALQRVGAKKALMSFFVVGGKSAKVSVPLGDYEIFYATGKTWYGIEHKFGNDTKYYKCDDIFDFTEDNDGYLGWTVTLYAVYDGNMETKKIDEDEFPP